MGYLALFVGLLALILGVTCLRLWLKMRSNAIAFELISRNRLDLLRMQGDVRHLIGCLFDHAGEDLAGSAHVQASEDLLRLGNVLRAVDVDGAEAQQVLAGLGKRYGIAPDVGTPFTVRHAIAIGELALHRVLGNSEDRCGATVTAPHGFPPRLRG